MKALTTAGLTKLIQLIKSSFISVDDTVTTTTVTLADVATTGDYDDLINKPAVPTVDTDDITISKNSDDELQTVGVIDQSDNNTAIKYWTGTKQEYDNIATKDPNQLYFITDDTDATLTLLNLLYPVGAIYIGTMSTCPLAVLGVGTWQLKATDRVLQGAGTRGSVGTTVNESLPNITGEIQAGDRGFATAPTMTGVFGSKTASSVYYSNASSNTTNTTYDFDASRSSSTYQDNAPVQQDAYLVNIWERLS